MDSEEFKKRTKAFTLRVIRLVEALPNSRTAGVIGHQLLRSGMSVGANYRSACRAKSRADFIAKMGIVEEECDESLYWMELLVDTGQIKIELIGNLMKESEEIVSLVVASIKTSRRRKEATIRNRESAIRNPKSAIGSSVGDVARE